MRPLACALVILAGCAGAPPRPAAPSGPVPTLRAQAQVITPTDGATEKELLERGERALLVQKWRDAADAFELLLKARPADPDLVTRATLDLGLAHQGLGEHAKAREAFERIAAGSGPDARVARQRLFAVLASLEDWPALGALGERTLGRADLEPMERMTALGARALSRIEAGEEAGALRDLEAGLDIKEEHRYGTGGRLPPPAAQLEFVQGEVRRVRSEKIALAPPDEGFLARMNGRCQGLMDAQGAYADAMRSEDPFWATISGYRVGQMYRAIHRDLMSVQPSSLAKTDRQKQVFYGIMHLRYRVLLEKGMDMMTRTLDFAARNGDGSWVLRSAQARREMELALEEEKAQIKSLPFTEEELQEALRLMEQHHREAAASTPAKKAAKR